jgi:hypothetical protein
VKTQFIGTWFISEMESWDVDYINLVGPGHLAIDPKGVGSVRFGAVDADLDWRIEDIRSGQKLQFTFKGFDEGDPVSGRGWATISGPEMIGRICFHDGDESGFKANREKKPKTSIAPTANVIPLPTRTCPVDHGLEARIYSAEILFKQHEPSLVQFAKNLNIVPEIVSEIEEDSWGTRGSLEIWFQETHGRKLTLHIQRAHFRRKETYVRDLQSFLKRVESLEYVERVQIDRH